jgi:hypothetical protein
MMVPIVNAVLMELEKKPTKASRNASLATDKRDSLAKDRYEVRAVRERIQKMRHIFSKA